MNFPLSAQDLGEALRLFESMPPEERRCWDARAHKLISHYVQQARASGVGKPSGAKAHAVEMRLGALASLAGHPGLAAWTLPGADGGDFISHELLEAAAAEELVPLDEYKMTFRADKLIDRLLGQARSVGSS